MSADFNPNECHPSHTVRSSDGSTYDFVCRHCGTHNEVPGGWVNPSFRSGMKLVTRFDPKLPVRLRDGRSITDFHVDENGLLGGVVEGEDLTWPPSGIYLVSGPSGWDLVNKTPSEIISALSPMANGRTPYSDGLADGYARGLRDSELALKKFEVQS